MITAKEKQRWLIDAIYATSYDETTGEKDITAELTDAEKLSYIARRLKSEAFYEYNIKRFQGNEQRIIAEHLQGLPSWLNVPYTNWDILQLLRNWGYDTSTEKKEDMLLSRYWGSVAMIMLIAFKAYKIKL